MTPKEKADELISQFSLTTLAETGHKLLMDEVKALSKQCALIAVEFAREQFYKYCSAEMCTDGTYDDHFDRLKQEIEKL